MPPHLPQGRAGAYAANRFFSVTSNIASDLRGYNGGTFDGRYAYFAPSTGGVGASSGRVLRLDTTASFTAAPSWSVFDMEDITSGSLFRYGAQFDGRFAYFLPDLGGGATSSTLMRYDTTQDFSETSAWSALDLAAADPDAVGFIGGAIAAGYLYLSPTADNSFNAHGNVTRSGSSCAGILGPA